MIFYDIIFTCRRFQDMFMYCICNFNYSYKSSIYFWSSKLVILLKLACRNWGKRKWSRHASSVVDWSCTTMICMLPARAASWYLLESNKYQLAARAGRLLESLLMILLRLVHVARKLTPGEPWAEDILAVIGSEMRMSAYRAMFQQKVTYQERFRASRLICGRWSFVPARARAFVSGSGSASWASSCAFFCAWQRLDPMSKSEQR